MVSKICWISWTDTGWRTRRLPFPWVATRESTDRKPPSQCSGPNSKLWAHEFNKHATCINTLAPSCYGEAYRTGMEVVDYFTRATALFRSLDTYRALEAVGIVPDAKRHYPLADIQKALERFSGGRVVLRCSGRRNVLHEAWYVWFLKGPLQKGEFMPAKDGEGREGDAGNCVPWVRYPPKKHTSWEL